MADRFGGSVEEIVIVVVGTVAGKGLLEIPVCQPFEQQIGRQLFVFVAGHVGLGRLYLAETEGRELSQGGTTLFMAASSSSDITTAPSYPSGSYPSPYSPSSSKSPSSSPPPRMCSNSSGCSIIS